MGPTFGEYFVVIVLVVAAIVAIVLSGIAKSQNAKRRVDLAEFAATDGFEYFPSGLGERTNWPWDIETQKSKDPMVEQLEMFFPFNFGTHKHVHNLLTKSVDEQSIYAMDYCCLTGDENTEGATRQQKHFFSIIAVRLGLIWPYLRLSPEDFANRFGRIFGAKDLSFESEEFNRKYFVVAESEREAYDILHPKSIEFLLRTPPRDWQMANMFVVVCEPGSLQPQEIRRVIQEIQEFIDLVPDYVKQDRGFEPRWTGSLDF